MRMQNTLKNTLFAIIAQALTQVLNFINRTLFIYFLGINYLGVSGLFGNILSTLSLAELGIGSAIIYNMYKPLAEKNITKIKQLINFYKDAYRIIAAAVFIIGISLVPFLDFLMKEKPDIPDLNLIYLLYLAGTISTYLCAHKRSLIIADQKEYINTINNQLFAVIQAIIDGAVIVFTQNFVLYLFLRVIITTLSNINISLKVDRLYPFLKEKKVFLDLESKKNIYKHMKAMMCHQIGGVVVLGKDNLLIAAFIGISFVGLYSNYLLITGTLITAIGLLFNSAIASVGNLNAAANAKKSYDIFRKMFFLNAVLYSIATVCLFNLLNDFIYLWIGKSFLLDGFCTTLIILNFYIMYVRHTVQIFRNTMGLFYEDRFRPIIVVIVNLTFSIILSKAIGFPGILLGTFLSTACITVWWEPYILFKLGFRLELKKYFIEYFKFIAVIVVATLISYPVCQSFNSVSWVIWIIKAGISISLSIFVIFMFFRKSQEFIFTFDFITNIIKKIITHKTLSCKY